MPDESPSKRKIDSDELTSVQLKRTKSIAHDDLRQSIVKRNYKTFEERILKLEARILKLEENFQMKKKKSQKKRRKKKRNKERKRSKYRQSTTRQEDIK